MAEVTPVRAGAVWNESGCKEKPWSAPNLAPLFAMLTSEKTAPMWARRAVKFIHRYTREHDEAPTFREVFTELAAHDPDNEGHAEAWASPAVRSLTMSHWRRMGWVRYRQEHRTLRSGPAANDLFPATPARPREGVRREGPGAR